MVVFRAVQGVSGAFLVPLAQATLFDINPREKHGQAMALFGGGIMIGPILGPLLGGWLTDSYNWRWVFLVNIPVGTIATVMLLRYMPKIPLNRRKFDLVGFALIGLFLASLQMMLDRGQQLDWFQSTEIWIEGGTMIAALWMFLVHTLTTEHPLFERSMFTDRNFATGLLFMAVTGVLLLAGLALLPPLLQRLYGYSVLQSGMLTMPRGIGTLISMLTVGRISKYIDTRWLVALGMGLMGWSLHIMSGFALVQGSGPVILSGVIQGMGLGMLFVTIQALAFTTLIVSNLALILANRSRTRTRGAGHDARSNHRRRHDSRSPRPARRYCGRRGARSAPRPREEARTGAARSGRCGTTP